MEEAPTVRVVCPLRTSQIIDIILNFVQLYNEPAGIELYNYQRIFMRRIIESLLIRDGAVVSGLWSRQSGKSEAISSLAGALCIFIPVLAKAFPDDERLIMYKNGLAIGVFAPRLKQSGYIYDRVRTRANKDSSLEIYADPDINIEISVSRGDQVSWTNGSYVRSQTASEQSNVEGGTYNLIIIDEAQLLSRAKVSKEIMPMLAATNGTCVKIGTAHVFRGGFLDTILHNQAVEQETGVRNHFEFPYDVVIEQKRIAYNKTKNPFHLNYEAWVFAELERMGNNLENDEFKMNFRLCWQELNLGAVDREAFYAGAEERLETGMVRQSRRQVAGLDFARMHDQTVLTIIEIGDPVEYNLPSIRKGSEDHKVSYCEKTIVAWYEANGRWKDQIEGILAFLSFYAVDTLCVDATGVGDPLAERLSDMLPHIHVEPVKFSTVSKDRLYKNYLQEIAAGRLRYAAGEQTKKSQEYLKFVHEHESLEKHWTGQYLKCQAPEGDHEDYCDSGALACWAAKIEPETQLADIDCSENPFYANRGSSRYETNNTRADRYRNRR